MTPSGIEPATLPFIAQYLNHCATEGVRVRSDIINGKGNFNISNVFPF
jgi:hypothetical protein